MRYSDKTLSPGKQSARLFAYKHMTPAQKKKYHILIVGFDKDRGTFQCDDIPHLISLGVMPEHIIACGFGHATYKGAWVSASTWAAMVYGVVASDHEDIVATVLWAVRVGYKLGTVNVDLCGSVLQAGIVGAIMAVVGKDSLIFFTHCYRKDGLGGGDKAGTRLAYLERKLHRRPDSYMPYQSTGYDSNQRIINKGMAMCVNVFKRTYSCSKCTKVVEHPARHKKQCKG